jgi:hypothetical protein
MVQPWGKVLGRGGSTCCEAMARVEETTMGRGIPALTVFGGLRVLCDTRAKGGEVRHGVESRIPTRVGGGVE